MGYNKDKKNLIWAIRWGQKVLLQQLLTDSFYLLFYTLLFFFIIVPLPAFFQYKGRRL